MHPGVMAARQQVAAERISAAAATLAQRLGLVLPPIGPAGPNAPVAALKRLEAVAELLEAIAATPLRGPKGAARKERTDEDE